MVRSVSTIQKTIRVSVYSMQLYEYILQNCGGKFKNFQQILGYLENNRISLEDLAKEYGWTRKKD